LNVKYLLLASLILLSGCAADQMKPILDDLQHCKRSYTFSLSSGSAGIGTQGAVTGNIECQPLPPVGTP
jgi:hypothetical protein